MLKPYLDSKNISSAFIVISKLVRKKNYREWSARILIAYRALSCENLIDNKPTTINLAELETRDSLFNIIVGILLLEIYGMYIIETLVVKLLKDIKDEYKLMILTGKSMQQVSLFEI